MATNSSDPCQEPMVVLPGYTPNFNHHVSFQPITIGVGSSLLIIAVICIGVRFAAALREKGGRLLLDDYFCVAALLFSTVCLVTEIMARKDYGHAWDMSECEVSNPYRYFWEIFGILAYYPAIMLVKMAVCTVYLRLFTSIQWIRTTTWTVMILYSVVCLMGFVLALSKYIKSHWNDDIGNTIDLRPVWLIQTASTILIDCALVLIPIPPILQLTLSLRRRVGIVAVFLGLFGATICSAALLGFKVEYYYTSLSDDNYDWTWWLCVMKLIILVEMFLNIILCCIPGLVAAWRKMIRNSFVVLKLRSIFASWRGKASQEPHSQNGDMEHKVATPEKDGCAVQTDVVENFGHEYV